MELSIEQALQQGVAAHKKGELQEAERLYQAIIQSQPLHPDANHNLGVLAVSFNKTLKALSLFKIALEANPKIEQFWLSYIDALIKEQQFDNAKQILQQAKKQGVTEERLNFLEVKLTSINEPENFGDLSPSQQQLSKLLECYQNGQLGEVEKLALSITQEFPKHQFGWKVLGAVYGQTGRNSKAVDTNQIAVALSPQDATAHNNLGIGLLGLGRLDEAVESYNQAIVLKPDYVEAHFNLGTVFQELGRLDEAEASYIQAIALIPDFTEAHNKLLKCLYTLDKQSLFFDKLDYFINKNIANATIGSLTCRSALKYGVEKPNLFCREPLKYVLHTDMNAAYDFQEIFIEKARLILNEEMISNRGQSLLVNGSQTSGNLFDIKNSFTEKIQNAIRLEIEKYRIKFKDSEDGLIKKWPAEYSLFGWLVSMKSGGEIKPHIHDNGWLSGSLYINVPPKLKDDSGNIVVSLGEEKDKSDPSINMEKIINVFTGSMVLFPASLTHYTIPFESKEERIVLAFDVKEK